MITGKPVEGEIVGYVRGAKGAYGFVGYNYRIRLEYKGEVYYVTALEGVTTMSENIPKKNLGMYCCVYFNPKAPKKNSSDQGISSGGMAGDPFAFNWFTVYYTRIDLNDLKEISPKLSQPEISSSHVHLSSVLSG